MMIAHDVVPYLKAGTIVVGVNFRSVVLVTEDSLVNIHNGTTAEYHEWYHTTSRVEIFENLEDWEQADSPMEIHMDEDDFIKERDIEMKGFKTLLEISKERE